MTSDIPCGNGGWSSWTIWKIAPIADIYEIFNKKNLNFFYKKLWNKVDFPLQVQ